MSLVALYTCECSARCTSNTRYAAAANSKLPCMFFMLSIGDGVSVARAQLVQLTHDGFINSIVVEHSC